MNIALPSNQVYLTDIKTDRSLSQKAKKRNSISQHKRLNSVNEMVHSLNEKKRNNKILNEEFLDFLINEKTNFADLDKVEKHYQNLLISQYKTYNLNKTVLLKKAKEYNTLTTQIETELVSRMNFSQQNLDSYYDKLINQIQSAIRLKEHEFECYRNTYRRLYKSNYLLKKRYEEEMKIQNLNDEQHEKYTIIKNHAILTITNQNTMLNNMKMFYELSSMTYANDINKKIKKFNELEFQVMMIKKDTKDIEEAIALDRMRQIEIKKKIEHNKKYNTKLKHDLMSYYHDFAKIKIKLHEIYSQLKVKDLNEIIHQFNQNLKKYQMLSSLFALANNDIVVLNNELTELNKEKEEINIKLNKKKKSSYKKVNKDAYDFSYMKEKLSQLTELNINYQKQISIKVQKLKLLVIFLVDYIVKIQDSLRNCVMNNFFILPKIFGQDQNKVNILLQFLTVTKNKTITINYEKIHSIPNNTKFFQFLLYIFNIFTSFLFLIISSAYNNISVNVLNGLHDQFELFSFSNPKIKNEYEHSLHEAFIHNESKEKILKRSDREIFTLKEKEEKSTLSKRNSIPSNKLKSTITDSDLYKTYINYIKKKDNNDRERNTLSKFYLLNRPRQSIMLMNKFSNELVLNKALSPTLTSRTIKINNFKQYIETPTTTASKSKRDYKEEILLNENEVYDKSDIQDEVNYNTITKTKPQKKRNQIKYGLSTKNPEMDKVYMRLNDLRKLELNYSKDKNSKKKEMIMNSSDLNEIYYKFKKKFMRNQKSKSIHRTLPSVNTINNNRNRPNLTESQSTNNMRNARTSSNYYKTISSNYNQTITNAYIHSSSSLHT